MYYTIIPADILMSNQKEEEQYKYQERKYMDQIVQVIPAGDNKVAIQRVITTDPAIYLSKKYEPGTIIEYSMTTAL